MAVTTDVRKEVPEVITVTIGAHKEAHEIEKITTPRAILMTLKRSVLYSIPITGAYAGVTEGHRPIGTAAAFLLVTSLVVMGKVERMKNDGVLAPGRWRHIFQRAQRE